MPIISQTGKLGRSADTGDLLAQRKRNIVNLEIASKKALGIFKPALYSRSFDVISLQSQNGLDDYLNAGRIPGLSSSSSSSSPPATYVVPSATGSPVVGTGTPVPGPNAPAGSGITFTSPTNTPSTLTVFPYDAGNGIANFVAYANNTWVVAGQGTSSVPTNAYYGPALTTLLPLTLFNGGGFSPYITYANSTWVFCNQDKSTNGYNVYYGATPATLRALPIFGNTGAAYFAVYANNTWVICGQDKSGLGYNVYFGSDLANLTPLSIFGNNGSASYAAYGNGQWAIGGYDLSGNRNHVYIGSSLTALLPLSIFVGGCKKIVYLNNTWVVGGYSQSSSANPAAFYYGSTLNTLVASTRTFGGNYGCIEINYANGTWVLGLNTNTQTNVVYGADLGNLTSLNLFGVGGSAKSIVYENGLWAIGGLNANNNSQAIFYGTNLASLTPKTTKLGYFLAYLNGLWVAAGQGGVGLNNFAYGADLATTPM